MQSDPTAAVDGHPVSPPHRSSSRANLQSLQAKCRHQAVVIDALSEAVSTFHRGAMALKAENAELRAELIRLGERRRSPAGAARHGAPMDEVVVSVELTADWFRVGVQDSGSDAVAVRAQLSRDQGVPAGGPDGNGSGRLASRAA